MKKLHFLIPVLFCVVGFFCFIQCAHRDYPLAFEVTCLYPEDSSAAAGIHVYVDSSKYQYYDTARGSQYYCDTTLARINGLTDQSGVFTFSEIRNPVLLRIVLLSDTVKDNGTPVSVYCDTVEVSITEDNYVNEKKDFSNPSKKTVYLSRRDLQ